MELWFTEENTPGYRVAWRVKEVLHRENTPFQTLAVVDTMEWGRALILDGCVQTTEKDEYIYHEMITHVPLMSHPGVSKVLIIGGGDGGVLREVARYPYVEAIHLVEIDQRVVEASQEFLPSIACSFDDPRVSVTFGDGLLYVKEYQDYFDLVIVDSSDPVGPAVELFGSPFYGDIARCLTDDGMVVVQSESPIFYEQVFRQVQTNLSAHFPLVKPYLAAVPTYTSGPWTFTCGSKRADPQEIVSDREAPGGLKYYNAEVHEAAFVLPQFINRML
jgi:spermidine synthase